MVEAKNKEAKLGKALLIPVQFIVVKDNDKALVINTPKPIVMDNISEGFKRVFKEEDSQLIASLLSSEEDRLKFALYFTEDKTKAAKVLGISVRNLHRKINHYKINR